MSAPRAGRPRAASALAVVATALAASALAVVSGCAGEASYIWAEKLEEPASPPIYLIASGDVLGVRVFNQDNISTRARVRNDGKIAVPFVGEIDVLGKPPATVARELSLLLKAFVVSPTVTVTVEESQPASVSVMGEVAHPGNYPIDGSTGVLQALAAAGGFTDYAGRGSIYVVRRSPPARIRFTYAGLIQGAGGVGQHRLHAGDVLLVE